MADPPGRQRGNSADLSTAPLKHSLGQGVVAYAAWAVTANKPYAHYDLGAGGVR